MALFVVVVLMISYSDANCIFQDAKESSYTLDLRTLSAFYIEESDPIKYNTYFYTPCNNNVFCNYTYINKTDYVMVGHRRYNDPLHTCNAANAQWDNGRLQPMYDDNTQTWTFIYTNGDDLWCWDKLLNQTVNRTMELNFICSHNLNTEYSVLFVGEIETGSCYYQMMIETELACISNPSINNNNNQWSGGSVFLMVIIIVMFAYCVSGCIGNRCRKFPHQAFWEKLPKYVFTGSIITKEFVFRGKL
eukprot:141388_1